MFDIKVEGPRDARMNNDGKKLIHGEELNKSCRSPPKFWAIIGFRMELLSFFLSFCFPEKTIPDSGENAHKSALKHHNKVLRTTIDG